MPICVTVDCTLVHALQQLFVLNKWDSKTGGEETDVGKKNEILWYWDFISNNYLFLTLKCLTISKTPSEISELSGNMASCSKEIGLKLYK